MSGEMDAVTSSSEAAGQKKSQGFEPGSPYVTVSIRVPSSTTCYSLVIPAVAFVSNYLPIERHEILL